MKLTEQELNLMNSAISEMLSSDNNELSSDILDFVFAKSKKLRPRLIFLFANAFNHKIDRRIVSLACATELLHDSTLIHDDIIDNADIRRNKTTLNKKFGNAVGVLAGDYLLSLAMRFLCNCNSPEAINEFAKSMQQMCKGEINQHFEYKQILSIDEYIEKSKNKTAELFIASLTSLCHITGDGHEKKIREFAINFGIAFQIKDDLLNLKNNDKTKPLYNDIKNGIYTAPVIFLNRDKNVKELSTEEIITLLNKNNKYFAETENLIELHVKKALDLLSVLSVSEYKKSIIDITRQLLNF